MNRDHEDRNGQGCRRPNASRWGHPTAVAIVPTRIGLSAVAMPVAMPIAGTIRPRRLIG